MNDNKKLIEEMKKIIEELKSEGNVLVQEYLKKMKKLEDILDKETADTK